MSIEARQIQETLYSYAAILNFTPSPQGLRAKFGACSVQNAQLLEPLSFIYLEKARQSFFSQTVEAKNMADFWRIMTPFDAIWRHFYGNG